MKTNLKVFNPRGIILFIALIAGVITVVTHLPNGRKYVSKSIIYEYSSKGMVLSLDGGGRWDKSNMGILKMMPNSEKQVLAKESYICNILFLIKTINDSGVTEYWSVSKEDFDNIGSHNTDFKFGFNKKIDMNELCSSEGTTTLISDLGREKTTWSRE